jgi:gas vesicle protein
MAENNNYATVAALMLVSGGIIGAGLALLYAPHSGKRTRKQITRFSKKVRNEAEELASDMVASVSDMVEDLGDKTSDLVDRGNEIAGEWRKTLLDTIDEGQRSLEKQRKKLAQLWS